MRILSCFRSLDFERMERGRIITNKKMGYI